MTTYIKCPECKAEFKSMIQVKDLKTNIFSGNRMNCPKCGKTILVENSNMFNK